MAKRRTYEQWFALKWEYRQRLKKRGVTERYYLSGGNLAQARGHGATPEKPRNYNPERYPLYHARKTGVTLTEGLGVIDAARVNMAAQVQDAIDRGKVTEDNVGKIDHTFTLNQSNADTDDLIELSRMTYDEIRQRAREDYNEGKKSSPFWYHS